MTDARPPGAAPVTVWLRRLVGTGLDQRVAGDTMLAAMAAAHGLPGVRVARDADGRPRLDGGAGGVHVSISHHQAYVATAITTRGPVGVDVEVVRDLPAQALADRFFAGHEARHIAGLDEADRAAEFLRLWTVKEAVGKALGTGLRGGGMRRPVGPLPPWPAADRLTLAVLAEVDGVAVAGYRDGDLLVAVACQARGAAGAPVSIRRDAAPDDRG